MRTLLTVIGCGLLVAAVVGLAAEQPKAELVFPAKTGDVTFKHAEHAKRADGECTFCHDEIWPKSTDAPLNYKKGLHKPAEKDRTSCATCHAPEGVAFATKGNCKNCHVKK